MARNPVRRAYTQHRNNAKHRGIPFELTFDEWVTVWRKSRRWSQKGNRGGKYVMARYGDAGPYAVGNVRITLFENNLREAKIGKPRRDLAKLNKSRVGQSLSPEHRKKIADGLREYYHG
jgi:hypothetical protein